MTDSQVPPIPPVIQGNEASPLPGLPAKKKRPWFKKKRFIIPIVIIVLWVAIASIGGGKSETAETATPAVAEAAPSAEEVAATEADAAAQAEAEAAAAATKAAEDAAAAAAEEAARGTLAQQNAQKSGENYLSISAFSHSGLVKQLEFEGYSTEDATWGVDRVGADWNEQAAKSAKNYLDLMTFSHSGLVDQLVFEGFSPEQAEYGVSQTGL